MKDSIDFPEADDPGKRERHADAVVKWASKFDGVEAFVVRDYIDGAPAGVNGVTIQWGIDENGDGIPEAAMAVHVTPGKTVSRDGKRFGVSA